jgi:hypothetical protein
LVTVEALERELAGHLGPIAKVLVKRAAARASSLDELARLLALELDSEQERRGFIDKATSFATA